MITIFNSSIDSFDKDIFFLLQFTGSFKIFYNKHFGSLAIQGKSPNNIS